MLLSLSNGIEYHPEYVNVGICEYATDKDQLVDVWLTKHQLFRLQFPENAIGMIRVGKLLEICSLPEAFALLIKLRSVRHDSACILAFDGYGSQARLPELLIALFNCCGFRLGRMEVRHAKFQPDYFAKAVNPEQSVEVFYSAVEEYLNHQPNRDAARMHEWQDTFHDLMKQVKESQTNFFPILNQGQLAEASLPTSPNRVIVNIAGGLGDHFFRYATARVLSIAHDAEIRFDDTNMRIHKYNGRHCVFPQFNTVGRSAAKQDFVDLIESQTSMETDREATVVYLNGSEKWPYSADTAARINSANRAKWVECHHGSQNQGMLQYRQRSLSLERFYPSGLDAAN